MGKREEVKKPKVDKDFYATIDPDAVTPLIPYIRGCTYAEPFYGNGDLEDLLMDAATCMWRSDVRKTVESSVVLPAQHVQKEHLIGAAWDCDYIISNPPFTKSVLLPCIEHLSKLRPTWLLLPADMLHNKYMTPYIKKCELVLSVGRLCWFPNDQGKMVKGVDNFIWGLFVDYETDTVFKGRIT
jgi:hypothetical protein